MKNLIKLLSILILLSTPVWGARIHIDIASPSFTRLKVAMPMFVGSPDLASQAWSLLDKDIKISGAFSLINPKVYIYSGPLADIKLGTLKDWSIIGADFVITGIVKDQGESIELEIRLVEVSTAETIINRTYTSQKTTLYKAIHMFMDNFLNKSIGLKGFLSTRIVCVADNKDSKVLYVCFPDGTGGYVLKGLGRLVLDPAWSPDAKMISFVSYKRNNPDTYILDMATKKTKIVSFFPGLNTTPAFYPDNKHIACTLSKDGNPEIYMMTLNGKTISRLTHNWATDTSPSISPDGARLVFCSSRGGNPQIYLKNMQSGDVTRITFKGSYNTEPVFSPRGDWVAFTHLADDRHFHIALIRPDGKDFMILKGTGKGDESPSFSPDGRLIVFASSDGNLYITDIAGSMTVPITHGEYIYSEPAWQENN